MNVAFDPWIPVVDKAGRPTRVGLVDIFVCGDKYADLVVQPHERIALLRLFLCVAHAALDGPKDHSEWTAVSNCLSEKCTDYLHKWKDSFELFHPERPWLQSADLASSDGDASDLNAFEKWTPATKTNFSFATGNNSTLFDHLGSSDTRALPIEDGVRYWLTYLVFSPGGLSSQVVWAGIKSSKTASDCPCVAASMLHSTIRGRDLFATILMNLATYTNVKLHYSSWKIGRPVWERFPNSINDDVNVDNATLTYLGRLVPIARISRWHSSGKRLLIGMGLKYAGFSDGFPPEPTATTIVRKKGKSEERALLSYRSRRAVWRELSAIIGNRNAQNSGAPLTLKNIPDDVPYDLVVSGLSRDQANIVDIVESVFHVSQKLASVEGALLYDAEVQKAEAIERRLNSAIDTYRRLVDGGWEGRLKGAGSDKASLLAKLHGTASMRYWKAVENSLHLLLKHIDCLGTTEADERRSAWRKAIFSHACDAYRATCVAETPRQIRAFASGWEQLGYQHDKS